MNLAELIEREIQLNHAIEATTQSLLMLKGHQAEIEFHKQHRLAKEAEEKSRLEVDTLPVECSDESI